MKIRPMKVLSLALFGFGLTLALSANADTSSLCLDACQAEFNDCLSYGPDMKPSCIADLQVCRAGC
jgi:hypothetical protein